MILPLFILLIPYAVLLLLFLILLSLTLYHMIKFGLFDFAGKMSTFLCIAFTLVVLVFTFLLLRNENWQAPMFDLETFSTYE